jgi:CRISPR-associated protein Csm3
MHKRSLNELTIVMDIRPHDAPLLIKSGREAGADPTLLDMNFVRSIHPTTGKQVVFLPGSSLKGTLRSYCERVARSVKPDASHEWCCNPFDDRNACGRRLDKVKESAARYAAACVACRTFGHTRLGSHLSISDAYPVDEVKLEQRDGVAIDRISGAVAAGPFNLEVVTQGAFRATLTLRNFQLWQVGWLAVALRDLKSGLVPIGFGKSKGFGRVTVFYQKATVAYPGQWQARRGELDFDANLYDLAVFQFEGKEGYSLAPATNIPLPGAHATAEDGRYGRLAVEFTEPTAIESLLLSSVPAWKAAVEAWPWSEQGGGSRHE